MKTILLWDLRFPMRAPTRLTLDDALASACVRAGVAAAADPAEQGALSAGAALDPGAPVEVVVQHGPPQRLARVIVPASVAAVGVGLGICAPTGDPIDGAAPPVTPAPSFTVPPSITPTSGDSGTTFAAVDGTVSNGAVTSRRWLLNGTSIGTGMTIVPSAAGALVLENTATGTGGSKVATSVAATVSEAGVLPAAMLGINEGILTQGKPTDWSRDLFHNSNWRTAEYGNDDGSMQINPNGYPTAYYQSDTAILLLLPKARSAARAGTYVVTYPAGMTCTLSTPNGASVVQAFSGGTGKISLPANDGTLGSPALKFSGPIPSGGIAVSVVKDGDAATGYYNPEASNALKALGKINRSMSARGVNSDRVPGNTATTLAMRTAATRYRGPTPNGPLCVEMQLDACNKAGQHMWHNQSHIDDDGVVVAEAAYVAANLAPGKRVYVELSNELWNTGAGFYRSSREMMLLGLRAGMGPSSATPTSLVPETIIYNDDPALPSLSNDAVTRWPVNTGQRIQMMLNGFGVQCYEALANNPAGTTVTPISTEGASTADGKWRLVYGSSACKIAGQRYLSKRLKEVWAIWDAALIAQGRARAIHVLAWQYGSGIFASASASLDWDNLWQVTDRYAIAPYFGGGGGLAGGVGDLIRYSANYPSPTYPHPWTAAEKDLLLTDKEAFKNAFFAVVPDVIANTLASAANIQSGLAAYLAGKGAESDRIKLCSYECNSHLNFSDGAWPSTHQSALVTAHAEILADPRWSAAITTYFNGLLALGGEHCAYDRVGPIPIAYSSLSYWGFQTSDTDFSLRYQALAAINSGTVAPKPSFTVQPSITPTSGDSATEFTAHDGVVADGTIASAKWLLDGEVVGTEPTIVTSAPGLLIRRVVATGAGGSTQADSASVSVSSAVVPPATLPALGASYAAVRGTQLMVAGYSGPLFCLRRESDNAQQDFSAGADGLPSDSQIATFQGASKIYFAKVYDQTGNGRDLVFPTTNSNVALSTYPCDLSRKTASGALWFDTNDSSSGEVASTGHAIDMQNHSYFAVMQQTNGANGFLGALDDGTNTLSSWLYNKGWLRDRSTAGGYLTYAAQGVQPCRANPIVVGQTFTAAARRLYLAETSVTAAAAPAGTATRVVYSRNKFGDLARGARWCGDVVTSAALSTADGTTLYNAMAALFGVVTSFDRRLIIIGDSIMAGANGLTRNIAPWMRMTFAGSCEVINTAVSGEQMASEQVSAGSAYSPFVTKAGALYGTGKVVTILESGTNDLSPTLGNKSAASLLATANTFIGQLKTAFAGGKVAWGQILPRNDVTAANWTTASEAERVSYNASVSANSGSNPAHVVLLLGDTSSTMGATGAPNDATLYNAADRLHPTDLGSTYLATGQPLPPANGPGCWQDAINALWA